MFGKVLTLEQGLEVMGRVVITQEVLDEEGTEYNFDALIYDTADFLLNEKIINQSVASLSLIKYL
jgi:hypothetical protein